MFDRRNSSYSDRTLLAVASMMRLVDINYLQAQSQPTPSPPGPPKLNQLVESLLCMPVIS